MAHDFASFSRYEDLSDPDRALKAGTALALR
jgi:hypothetical protein